MKLLLDTHAFLWWDSDDAHLPDELRAAIESPRNQVLVSAVTVWEIAIKRASGKLIFGKPVGKAIQDHGFLPLPITVEQAEWAGGLPQLHRDPFDRLLIAQAMVEGLVLVTGDRLLLQYGIPILLV